LESIYLKTLVEVVRTGSLSRGAESLHVTQPAVSKRIKFMEEQYGCPLLDYSGNRMRPTRAGELVCAKARALLDIESELVTSLHLLSGKARVTFACTPAFGVAHLPAILRDFLLTCSDMAELKFVSSTPAQMQQGLTEGLFDAVVMESCERFDLSAFVVKPLPEAEVLFAAAPAAGVPEPLTSVDLLCDTPMLTRREGCCSRTLLEDGLRKAGRGLKDFGRVIVIDDLPVLIDTLLAGGGVSLLPVDLLDEHIKAGRIRTYRVDGFQHGRQRALVLAQPQQEGDAASHLVAAVMRHFGSAETGPAVRASENCHACGGPGAADAGALQKKTNRSATRGRSAGSGGARRS
jgi:LysR family transcriptional regulator, transcriptional activator of the cysJI operon